MPTSTRTRKQLFCCSWACVNTYAKWECASKLLFHTRVRSYSVKLEKKKKKGLLATRNGNQLKEKIVSIFRSETQINKQTNKQTNIDKHNIINLKRNIALHNKNLWVSQALVASSKPDSRVNMIKQTDVSCSLNSAALGEESTRFPYM